MTADAGDRPASKNVLQSAQRVLAALKIVCLSNEPVALSALAVALEVSEVAAYRAAETLVAAGYVRHAGNRRSGYEATLQVVELSAVLLKRSELRTVAAPLLSSVAQHFNESVTLAVPEGDSTVFVDRINGGRAIEFYCDIGRRLPLHIGAASRAILAHIPDSAHSRYLRQDLRMFIDPSLPISIDLRADRDAVRKHGYAISLGDVETGISSVASVICSSAGDILGSAAIANVSVRWTDDDIRERGQAMASVCTEIGTLCSPLGQGSVSARRL
jgi:DNA-binding IclR family transcriptional regulator